MERYKITKKEYESGQFIRIENFPILDKIFQLYFASLKNIASNITGSLINKITGKTPAFTVNQMQRLIKLTQSNKDLFLKVFGKQDFVWTYEYKNYAWAFKFSSGDFKVFTGNKGTSYEFAGNPTKEDAKELKVLLDFIINSDDTND